MAALMQHSATVAVAAASAARGLAGAFHPPPSKSLTQRGLVAAALAGAGSRLLRPLDAEDSRLLFVALRRAGHDLEWHDDGVTVRGRSVPAPGEVLMGNNGTGTRFMLAQLAATEGTWRLDGVPRLRERPVAGLVAALRRLGADVGPAAGGEDRLPLIVRGRPLRGGEVALDSRESSQHVSALLLLGARLERGLAVELPAPPPSRPYVALTADVLAAFGVAVREEKAGRRLVVDGGRLRPAHYPVEPDWSAAAFPFAAVACIGGEVTGCGLDLASHQGDARLAALLAAAGCSVEAVPGGVRVRGPVRAPLVADLRDAPDLFPALAVVVAHRGGRLTGLGGLRVKESDRLAVMLDRLAALGFEVGGDGESFTAAGSPPPASAPAAALEPAGDHRIAMALAVAGLLVPGTRIADPACVAKSWPEFWRTWQQLSS